MVKPASASLQASVPPPAPVPTIAKSTSSSSLYWRIGTQPPGRNTSGARPSLARGASIGSADTAVLPPHRRLVAAVLELDRLPRVAAVDPHPHVAARAGRPAPPDHAPRGRVRVVGVRGVLQDALLEEEVGRHPAPGRALQLAPVRGVAARPAPRRPARGTRPRARPAPPRRAPGGPAAKPRPWAAA